MRILIFWVFVLMSGFAFSQEICNNGIDDDADGFIDLNDTECSCSPLTTQPPSMIPNHSFEQMNCCPTTFSQVSCATGWIQASGATSDYHNCSYNNTINTPDTPYPDGPGYMGFWDSNSGFGVWKEYIGSCLLSPMLAGQTYTLTFSIAVGHGTDGAIPPYPPLNFTIFGTPNCSALPWAGTDCPTGSWTPLVSQLIPTSAPNPSPIPWQTVTVSFTPAVNINAIAVGPSCGAVSNSYSYIDNLVLNQTTSFNASLQEIGGWCTNNLQLFSPDAPLGTYQWYKDGIALLGEINDTLNLSLGGYSDGYYTLKIDSGGTCYIVSGTVAPAAPPVASFSVTNLCFGSVTSFTDLSTVATGSIVTWDWDAGDGIGFSSAQNPTYTYNAPGVYTVTLIVTSSQGCKDTVSVTGTVFEPPVASFTADTVCQGSTTIFNDFSTSTVSTIAGWNWDAGDGVGTATIQNPSYVYANAGTYNATLTVTDNNGCTDDTTMIVNVIPQPPTPVTCAGNVLVNPSFENPVVAVLNGNNIVGSSIPGWTTQFGGNFNIIKVNGTPYGAGADTAATGNQYVDIVNSSDYPTQTFTLTRTSVLSFSGYFSNRDASNGGYVPWTAKVDILDASSIVVASSTTFNFTAAFGNETWVYLSGTSTPLPVGTYRYRAFISDYGHFDEAFLCITPSVCEEDTIFLNASPTVAGATYNWTGPNSYISSQQNPIIPNATTAMAGTYTVSIGDPSSSCAGSPATTIVIVEQKPTVTVPANIVVCNGNNVAATIFTSNYASAAFNWTNDNPSIGIGASGIGDIPAFSAINNTSNPITATITVTPSVSTSPCIGIPATYTITINPTPTVTVPINNNVCVGAGVAATNFTSTTAGSTFDWTNSNTAIGLSASGNGNIPLFTATNTTTNPITATITVTPTADGCVGTASTYTITVYPAPTANFAFSNVCFGSSTPFTDLSTANGGTISSWNWDFTNNGTVDNSSQNPTFGYTSASNYTVELMVITSLGCKDSITEVITVNPIPVANFTPTSVCLYQSTNFIDASTVTTGNINNWQWDFGDSFGTSTQQNPTYAYTNSGNFNVILSVTTDSNCVNTITLPVTVYPKPTADFDTTDVCLNVAAQFTDQSLDNGGILNGWIWDFENDGVVDNLTQNPTHFYPAAGTYTIELIASTTDGCKDTLNKTVTIHPMPVADFTYINDCVNAGIDFTNISTVTSGTVDTWAWQFGDTQTSAIENPTNNYASEGVYNVQLVVTTNNNCKDTIVKNGIEVWPLPDVNFSPTSVCLNDSTLFLDLSSVSNTYTVNNNVAWSWNFGDGIGTSNVQHPIYMYTTDGIFNATVTVTTDHNCVNSTTLPVTVHPLPVVDFAPDLIKGCTPVCVTFTDNTQIQTTDGSFINQWAWDFNRDGITDNINQNPSNCFINPSHSSVRDFDIRLITTSNFGCKDTLVKSDYIHSYPIPLASFMYWPNDEASIVDNEITFTNQSIIAATWAWDLGDGTLTNVQHTVHEYTDTGFYLVELKIENVYGCKDSTQKYINIKPIYAIWIPNAFTPNGDYSNDFFYVNGFGIKELQMMIFDRWGMKLYDDIGVEQSWGGKYEGNIVPTDVYVYKIRAKDVFDEWHDYIGKVTLIR